MERELPDDVKRNTYTADRERGLHSKGLRTSSGEYQRAVSDVVEFLRGAGVEEYIIDELQEAIPRGMERSRP